MGEHLSLFSYKLVLDTGFAPNPFWGKLTLATCKPGIRKTKCVGDWIAGWSSKSLCNDAVGFERLVYLMKVSEVISIAEYYRDPRFQDKRPKLNSVSKVEWVGDNIYEPLTEGNPTDPSLFDRQDNLFHKKDEDLLHDLSGKNVLISDEFFYFGSNPCEVTVDRPKIPIGRTNYGVKTHDESLIRSFLEYVTSKGPGVHARPTRWFNNDNSWKQ